jgi:hypothetical protein
MISGKRLAVSLLVVMLLTVGGAVALLYFGQLPKKAPLRARPVFADLLLQPGPDSQNSPTLPSPASIISVGAEHTMSVPIKQQGGI